MVVIIKPISVVSSLFLSIHNFLIISNQPLEIFPRYLSEIVNSVFKGSIGDCSGRGGWDVSGLTGVCAGNTGLLFYLNDLPSDALSSTLSILSL